MLRVVEVDGLRLLQVKNPWCRVRWKGRYSPTDTKNWTTSLRKKLAYDVTKATKVDNGIFWIDYEAVRRFFGTMHMNWNPNLFRFSKVVHGAWLLAAEGPKRDRFNIFHNPQYHLEVKADNASFSVGDARGGGGGGSSARTIKTFPLWILLSRHQLVVENDDHDAKIPLVAIHAYKSHGRNQKIYCRSAKLVGPGGVYSNTPHRLLRLDLPHGREYAITLVVSQMKKVADVNFTLQVFSKVPIGLQKIQTIFRSEIAVKGAWERGTTAVGCPNYGAFFNNPQYLFEVRGAPQHAVLWLQAQEGIPINVSIFAGRAQGKCLASSGDYQRSFAVCDLPKLKAGRYVVVVSTFEPNEEGVYALQLKLERAGQNNSVFLQRLR